MITVSEEAIYAATRAVVAESPDRIYVPPANRDVDKGMCLYSHGDVPGCLVGTVLHRLGVPLADFQGHEGQPAYAALRELVQVSGHRQRVGRFLDEIQEKQDVGLTWSEALAHAEFYAPAEVVV